LQGERAGAEDGGNAATAGRDERPNDHAGGVGETCGLVDGLPFFLDGDVELGVVQEVSMRAVTRRGRRGRGYSGAVRHP